MPKLKTRKGVAKRFKITGTGKVVRRKGGSSHLMTGKSAKTRRKLRQSQIVRNETYSKALKHAMPYA
ncbi:MAG: 50S ribosomal protein L35 [Candidatus Omnitrophica bacterium]|nr:50S ribosomal protein L35 [Candidatus Omnitrophota bacterium]